MTGAWRRVGGPVRLLGIVLATVLLASCSGDDAATPDDEVYGPPSTVERPPARPGFVGHDGLRLTVDGAPVPLLGVNIYNAASRGNCWYDMRPELGGALETIKNESRGAANTIRVWFFQSLATADGRRDWTQLDRVLVTAREKGFRVVPVLADQWGACEGPGGTAGEYKDITWYEEGYRTTDPGGTVSYRDWAQEVTTRYRDDPTVALWSLINEAEAQEGRDGRCPPSAALALQAFTSDVANVVKAADPDHLLGFGTIGGGQCGTSGADYRRLHASPLIDVCEYHDYDVPAIPGDDERNGLRARLADCAALGKPLFVGEAGVLADEVGGVDARADVYRAKLAAQIPAGVAGFLTWGWSITGYPADDGFGIGPGDPSLPIFAM